MPDSKRFLHPEAIKRISRLDLRARHIVEGFLTGLHRSPYFGQSVEFRQHREYTTGDDLRHVDWKVWAKQDRYYVKQFEEDTNMRATLLVDVSNSMRYGYGPLNKSEYADTVAVSLAYLLLRQQDSVGCLSFDERIRATVPQRTKRSHLNSIIQSLSVNEPRDKTDMFSIFRAVAETYPRRGMMILISDLLDRSGRVDSRIEIAAAARTRRDGVSHHGRRRIRFPVHRPDAIRGPGNGRPIDVQSAGTAGRLFGSAWSVFGRSPPACVSHTCDYSLIRTSDPMDAALAHYLSNRLGMHHHV